MELVEGENLRGPLPLAGAVPLATQIAEALGMPIPTTSAS
jgi:hypothetical protein